MKLRHPHAGHAHDILRTFLLLLVTGSNGGLGCGETSAALDLPPPEDVLRSRFPEQAAVVLAQDEALVATPQGFSLQAAGATAGARALEMSLPRAGHGILRLRTRSGFAVRVRELGVEGEGTVAGRAVAYRRAGGTSFWTAAPGGGVEEWLHLEAGAARADEPVAVWEVEGATVRPRGEGVEVVDAGGMVRLWVTAPTAYAAGGRKIHAWMAGQAGRLELWVEPQEQAVLVDPLWTSAGSMTIGREYHTATLLPSGQVLVVAGMGPGNTAGRAHQKALQT